MSAPHVSFFRNKSFGMFPGTNIPIVSDADQILILQSYYIPFEADHRQFEVVGDGAYLMFEKTHFEQKPIKPLRGGGDCRLRFRCHDDL
ncbi:MAG: hypothetical protein ACOYXT_05075 [Bacteroidota bacterium]